MLKRFLVTATIVLALAGCDVASTVKDGMEKAESTASAVEKRVGLKPQVGFSYLNGSLATVTVQFSGLPEAPLAEIEKVAREEVEKTFQAMPASLVISFVFKGAA